MKKNEFIYHLIQTTSYSRECCVIKYYSVINLAATKKCFYVLCYCEVCNKLQIDNIDIYHTVGDLFSCDQSFGAFVIY